MKPTFSSLERADRCPASHALPHVYTTSADAEAGNTAHAGLAKAAEEFGLDNVSQLQVEAAFAYDRTGGVARHLGNNIGRKYSLEPGELAGTADIVGFLGDVGVPIVIDWKTGHNSVTPAVENLQLHALGLAWATLNRETRCEVRIFYTGTGKTDRHMMTPDDMTATRKRLADIVRRVQLAEQAVQEGKTPDVTVGSQCQYCPAMVACPAYTGLARAAMLAPEATFTVENAGASWRLAKRAERIIENVLDGLKAIAKREGIPLEDGLMVAGVEQERESFDQAKALELLKAKGATTEELASCKRRLQVVQVREVKMKGRAA